MPGYTRPRSNGRVRRGLTALAAAAALSASLLAAAAPADATTSDDLTGTHPAPVPELAWEPCGSGLECATANVPLDYDDPDGATIQLALARQPAADPAQRIGSLFFNPGGPGGSAVEILQALGGSALYSDEVLASFDIVAMDPRGVGFSTPVQCFDTPEEALAFHGDDVIFPDTPEEVEREAHKSIAFAEQCLQRQGDLLTHLSTANVARDLDLLRQAVGDDKLHYAGYSYGTYLGATYANLFPGNVGSLLLDAAVTPTYGGPLKAGALPWHRNNSDVGSAETLQHFFDLCDKAGEDCSFGADGDPRAKFDELLARVSAEPIELVVEDLTFLIGRAEVTGLTINLLYSPTWSIVADLLQALYEDPSAETLVEMAGAAEAHPLVEMDPPGLPGATIANEPQTAIVCADTDTPDDPFVWPKLAASAEARAPYAGEFWTYVSVQPCASWPEDPDRYLGPFDAKTSAPALIIGNLFDPATPYRNAVELSEIMPGSRLLTLDGVGHASIGVSACVDDAITGYLLDGALPGKGAVCQPDFQPFDPVPVPGV
jgi:pimeloyl-ACP methyl ester carboxylesterase